MNVPSENRLMEYLRIERPIAKQLREVMRGDLNENELCERYTDCADLDRQCYTSPGYHYLEETAINQLIEGHGAESIGAELSRWDSVQKLACVPSHTYINMGDTYIATLIRNNATGRWTVSSWGDLVESGAIVSE